MRTESGYEDDLRPEYSDADMAGAVRGKYTKQYREGANIILLDPDVWEAFPTAEAVNEALRLLIRTAKAAAKQAP